MVLRLWCAACAVVALWRCVQCTSQALPYSITAMYIYIRRHAHLRFRVECAVHWIARCGAVRVVCAVRAVLCVVAACCVSLLRALHTMKCLCLVHAY